MNIRKFVIFLILTMLAFACFACGKYISPTNQIISNDLVGKWVVTEDSLHYLDEMNLCCTENLTTMILTEEGKADLRNIPDCWAVAERACTGSLNFKGTWQLNDNKESQKGIIFFSQIGERQIGFSISILQRRDDPEKLTLMFGLGETETKRELYLEKVY